VLGGPKLSSFKIGGPKLQKVENRGTKTAIKPKNYKPALNKKVLISKSIS
jgi:hypothetical protein